MLKNPLITAIVVFGIIAISSYSTTALEIIASILIISSWLAPLANYFLKTPIKKYDAEKKFVVDKDGKIIWLHKNND